MIPHVTLREPPEVRGVGEVGSDGFLDSSRPRVTRVVNRQELFENLAFVNTLTNLISRRSFLASQIQVSIEGAESLRGELLERIRLVADQ